MKVSFGNRCQDLPKGSRLAFDVNVPDRVIGRYARAQHLIVCCAMEGEEDELFVDRAWAVGADIIFSQDADIGNIIDKENMLGMRWIRYV